MSMTPATQPCPLLQQLGDVHGWLHVDVVLSLLLASHQNLQARSQTFEKGGANFQEFMNSIYPEGYIVT